MSKFWSPFVKDLVPYVPGEQPKLARLVKLNTNENPYGPSPQALAAMQAERLAPLAARPGWENPRQLGTIAAIDLTAAAGGYLAQEGPAMRAHFLDRGVLLRPLGNTVYVMPPYCVTDDDMDEIWGAIASYR